jgi:hypothetical protein
MTDRPGLVGIHHMQVAAPRGSEDLLRRFYGDLLGLLVAELPAYVERLAAHGVLVEWDRDNAFPGYRRCYLHDPHGNRLELLESLPA